jgi:Peptidase MA superfamily/Tetratricopeptide repeat
MIVNKMRSIITLSVLILIAFIAVPVAAHQVISPRAYTGNENGDPTRIGHRFLHQWRVPEARNYVDRLQESEGSSARVLYLMARVAFFEGNYSESRSHLGQLKKLMEFDEQLISFEEIVIHCDETTRDYVERESVHFKIRTPPGPDEVLGLYALPALEQAYLEIGGDLGIHPQVKILVEVYRTRRVFSGASSLTAEEVDNSGTIALCKYGRLMITSPRSLVRGYGWLDTVVHEFVHFLITLKTANRTPIWLHEGIAKYEETRWREKKGGHLSPSGASLLAEAFSRNYEIPFKRMHPSFAKLRNNEETSLAFAQVVTIIDMVIDRYGYESLRKILVKIKNGLSDRDAIAEVLGVQFDGMLDQWRDHVRKKKYTVVPGLKPRKLEFREPDDDALPLKEEDSEEDEEQALENESTAVRELTHLGNLLRDRGRNVAAAIEYEKAATSTKKKSPVLLNKLALAYIRAGKFKRATTHLNEAIKYFPGFVTSYQRLGVVYQSLGELERSRDYLIRAIGINPYNPHTHKRLMKIQKALGDEKGTALENAALDILSRR